MMLHPNGRTAGAPVIALAVPPAGERSVTVISKINEAVKTKRSETNPFRQAKFQGHLNHLLFFAKV